MVKDGVALIEAVFMPPLRACPSKAWNAWKASNKWYARRESEVVHISFQRYRSLCLPHEVIPA